jgi:hypothetical protein
MAKGIYVGVGGVAHKAKKIYVGAGGVAHKVKKIYVGVNGVARLAYASGPAQSGQVIFTSSQIWTVPSDVETVQVFLVGGGGTHLYSGAGGGYTLTRTVTVTPGALIAITVGAGGPSSRYRDGLGNGGASSFGAVTVSGNNGENGGSGGGAVGRNSAYLGGNGGSDGSNGHAMTDHYKNPVADTSPGGTGQGFTTRAFGEASGTLYAGGGGGMGYNYDYYESPGGGSGESVGSGRGGAGGGGDGGTYDTFGHGGSVWPATPNTGGGAGGACDSISSTNAPLSYEGGSGIVIVRWFAG